jgi:hypothetical protein
MNTAIRRLSTKRITDKLSNVIFVVCFAIFFVCQFYLTYKPIAVRSLPVETDDAYRYLIKASEINSSCLLQDCPALDILREQLTSHPTSDFNVAYNRARQYQGSFVIYTPAYSLAIAALNLAGFTYEKAYDLISLAGVVLIAISIAYWLFVIFGKSATSLSLLLLAPLVFQGQGFHTVVPGTLALAFSLILWGLILQGKSQSPWIVVFLILLILFTHSLGIVFSLIALLLFILKSVKPITNEQKITILVILLIILTFAVFLPLIHRPEFDTSLTNFYRGQWNYWENLRLAAQGAYSGLLFWLDAFANDIGVISLLFFAILLTPNRFKQNLVLMTSLTSALLITSLFYVNIWFGSIAFERALVPMGILFTGILSMGIVKIGETALEIIKTIWNRTFFRFQQMEKLQNGLILLLCIISLALVANQTFQKYLPYYRFHYELTLSKNIERKNYRVDQTQPEIIFRDKQVNENSIIIYKDELSLGYFLTHGGLDYGAIYSRAIDEEQLQSDWLKEKLGHAAYLVGENPIFDLQHDPDMRIGLDDNAKLGIMGVKPIAIDSFQVYIIHHGRPVDLEILWNSIDRQVITKQTIPDNFEGWIEFGQGELHAQELILQVIGNRSIIIQGIRIDQDEDTNWPWDPGIILTLIPEHGDRISVEVSSMRLAGNLPLKLSVVDDDGKTILAKVIH